MIEKAKTTNVYKEKVDKSTQNKTKFCQPWFNNECLKARDNYYKVKNKLKFISQNDRQSKVKAASKRFKDTIKKTKDDYFKQLHKKT